jgi:uracil phosphoribosyltransferase
LASSIEYGPAPRLSYRPNHLTILHNIPPVSTVNHPISISLLVMSTTSQIAVAAPSLPANARLSTNLFLASKLNHLRDRSRSSSEVRATTAELARILAVEATQGERPGGKVGLIVVLRSGLAMCDAFLSQFAPDTDVVVYHIGMFRERTTLQPVEYYNMLPNINTDVKRVYVVDPLIATGGTSSAIIEILK